MDEIESFEDLLAVQAEDTHIDRLLEERSSLPELEVYRKADARTKAIGSKLGAAEEGLKELARAFDKADGELTILEEKKNAEERRLYAGGLNARETEALMAEVESLQRRAGSEEEAALALMEQRDAAAAGVDGLRAEMAEADAEKAKVEAAIKEAWAAIDAEIARHEAKKAELMPLVAPDLIEIYEELRKHKPIAAARLNEGMCGACQLRLSEAEQLAASRADPPRCVHCGAILAL